MTQLYSPRTGSKLDFIVSDLAEDGYSVTPNVLSKAVIDDLKLYAKAAKEAGNFKPATIGKDEAKQRVEDIRGDLCLWVDNWKQIPALEEFHQLISTIMDRARTELYVPAKRFEGHYAVYPPGTGYRAHLDQHAGSRNRLLSIVLYLSDVPPTGGGELKLHNTLKQSPANIIITPRAGTLVVFVSSKILHEVLPTNTERWSLTGWIRDDA